MSKCEIRVFDFDMKKYCLQHKISVIWDRAERKYKVMQKGRLMFTSENYLTCENYIYEVYIVDKYSYHR